jgi:VWFA-related protein
MRSAGSILLLTVCSLFLHSASRAQEYRRELKLAAGASVQIVNRSGRVAVRTEKAPEAETLIGTLAAASPAGVSETEVRVSGEGGRATISVKAADAAKRIDLVLTVPERTKLKIDAAAGAVEVAGNFTSVEVRTDTGTIATDVPTVDVKYQLRWTESRPRFLADFEIAEVKEKSGGRFEIKGTYRDEPEEVKSKKSKGKEKPGGETVDEQRATGNEPPNNVSLNFTTARGIILLNVPPTEVMSDLRERPLTNAAKAIIRSGDSLLMEAIRRASPKYFGDYARTLPPMSMQPKFTSSSPRPDVPDAPLRTALVRVTDLGNRAIAGLGAGDFEVNEDGRPHEVVSVTRSTAPFNLVLLLDVSGSVENYVNFIRKAARSFVNTVEKDDRLSIVTFSDDVYVLSKFTTDKEALSKSLDSFDAGGGTAYYDALAYALADTLRPLRGERTAIVILTDGDDNRSFLAFDTLAGSIQESGALIYPLYVPSGLIALAAQNTDVDPIRSKYMSVTAKSHGEGERLARISGGIYYPITQLSQIQQAYEDIVVQMRSAYLVTFRTDSGAARGNGVSPRLKIRARRENVFTTVISVEPAPGN